MLAPRFSASCALPLKMGLTGWFSTAHAGRGAAIDGANWED